MEKILTLMYNMIYHLHVERSEKYNASIKNIFFSYINLYDFNWKLMVFSIVVAMYVVNIPKTLGCIIIYLAKMLRKPIIWSWKMFISRKKYKYMHNYNHKLGYNFF